jgi:hypothetical protein
MKKYSYLNYNSGPVDAWLNIPFKNKHYRVYSSQRANAYKKYHGKVRNSIVNNKLSSLAAHKAWLTRELDDIKRWYKQDIIEQCNELLSK